MTSEENYWNTEEFIYRNYKVKQSYDIPTDADKLLMFINTEDRSFGLINNELIKSTSIKNVHLIILNRDLDQYVAPELDKLIDTMKNRLSELEYKFHLHFFNFYDEGFATQLYRVLADHHIFDSRVILDITTCPPVVILPLTEILLGHQNHTITFAYSIPKQYDVNLIQEIGNNEANDAEIKIYGSKGKDKTALAIVAGFEDEKAHKIVENIDPDIGYIFNNIFDKDLTQSALAKTTMKLHHDLLKLETFKQFHLPRFDLNRIFNTFDIIDKTKEDYNIIMACFGSKIQRLAMMLFVSLSKDKQFVDLIPDELSFEQISSGYSKTLFYSIARITTS